MDVRYINPFIAAVQHVFKVMLDAEIVISKPCLKDNNAPHTDVSAIIGFTGNATGSVSLCFAKQSAVKIASKFADTELSIYDTAELADALGELTNMVAGQAKASLPTKNISVSLPRVVLGDDHVILTSERTPVVVLRCDSALGRFSVEVVMQMKKAGPIRVQVAMDIKDRGTGR